MKNCPRPYLEIDSTDEAEILTTRIRESTTTITLCAKFNRNLRCRVLFRDFFGRSVVECPNDQLLQPMHVKRKLMSERNVGISIRDMWKHSNMYVLVCLHDFFYLDTFGPNR